MIQIETTSFSRSQLSCLSCEVFFYFVFFCLNDLIGVKANFPNKAQPAEEGGGGVDWTGTLLHPLKRVANTRF